MRTDAIAHHFNYIFMQDPQENVSVSRTSDSSLYGRPNSGLPGRSNDNLSISRSCGSLSSATLKDNFRTPNVEGVMPPPLPPKPSALLSKTGCLLTSSSSPTPSPNTPSTPPRPLSVKDKARAVAGVLNRQLRSKISKHGLPPPLPAFNKNFK